MIGRRYDDGSAPIAQCLAGPVPERRRHDLAELSGDKVHRQLDVLEQFAFRDRLPTDAADRLLVAFPHKSRPFLLYRVQGEVLHDTRQDGRLVGYKAKSRAGSREIRIDLFGTLHEAGSQGLIRKSNVRIDYEHPLEKLRILIRDKNGDSSAEAVPDQSYLLRTDHLQGGVYFAHEIAAAVF